MRVKEEFSIGLVLRNTAFHPDSSVKGSLWIFYRCSHEFIPPAPPHRCLNAVRSCPEEYNDPEVISMCELAPVDYRMNQGKLYRNRFCQLCHGLESPTLSSIDELGMSAY